MIGPRRGGKGQSSGSGSAGMAFAGLFRASDSDDEQDYGGGGGRTAATSPPSAKRAQQDWSLFPDKEEALVQPAAAPAKGGRRSESRAAAAVTGLTTDSTPAASEKVAGGKKKKKTKTKKSTAAVRGEHGKAIPPPLHAGVENEEENDLEAAIPTQPPSSTKSADERAIDEFELNKDRSPAEWMRVRDTTGTAFLWYTVILQIASAFCSLVFLASHGENQLSWKTGCWGMWTSLADAENVEFVEFDTHIGWQLYGKGDKLGLLSEVSERAAVVGGLAGGMHTLMVFIGLTFLFFSLSALWLSYHSRRCPARRPSEGEGEGEEDGPTKPAKHDHPLGLGRDCHRWMFVMAGIDILAGLWCFGIGCAGFYFVITREFTDGLKELVSGWGEDVSCARPQTRPRYGFYVNAVSVLLLLGGGVISLYKTYTSDRDLREAVEMWENDRAEAAEMEARLAMIRKKEDYAAAVASAAASAALAPVTIFKSKKKTPPTTTPPVAADGSNEAEAAAAAAAAAAVAGGVDAVLPLSPSSQISRQTTRSFASTAAAGPEERHKRTVTIAALSAVDLESDDGNVNSAVPAASSVPSQPPIPASPCRPSPEPELGSAEWDVENGAGAAGVAVAAAAAAAAATPDNTGKGAVEDDLPPPQGWEVRTTPSGDKFWVNILTKNVAWEKPTE